MKRNIKHVKIEDAQLNILHMEDDSHVRKLSNSVVYNLLVLTSAID